jgi:Uma2 family endonuclease
MGKRTSATIAKAVHAAFAPRRRRFNVDEYYRMAEAGILGPDERVELLGGEIYEMAPMGSRHAGRVRFLDHWFDRRLGGRGVVSAQCPLRLSDGSEPEPDLALLRIRPDDPDYDRSHPLPGDVLLVVEIADTSLSYDRDRKLPRYAEAGIPEVWIVDLTRRRLLAWREPSARRYQASFELAGVDTVAPLAFPDLRLTVGELLA